MANILLDGTNWQDPNYGDQPPAYWTGATYEYIGSNLNGQFYLGADMTYQGTVNAGDICAGSITSTSADTTAFSITINGTPVATQELATNQTYPFSFTLSTNDTVSVLLGTGQFLYSQDAVLTPTAEPTITAQNTAISMAYEAAQTSLPYIVLENGTQTPPDSLAIITPPTYGTAQVNGQTIQYIPNQGYSGPDSLTYTGTIDGITSNVATIAITMLPPAPCDELGRVTRAYVSGYQRDRVHRSDLVRGEARCLCAEFRGAINPARSIVSVQWMCQQPYAIFMSNARISGTECAVTISAQAASWCYMKCIATLDNGEQYTQLFYLTIRSAPYFFGEIFPTMSGPTILTAQQA